MRHPSKRFCASLFVILVTASLVIARDAPSYVNTPDAWFATDEGKTVCRQHHLPGQMPTGGWEKEYDALKPNTQATPTKPLLAGSPEAAAATQREAGTWDTATIDNNATHSELRILARAVTLQNNTAAKDAFFRGFDALLAAQYPNGGWPQPLPAAKQLRSLHHLQRRRDDRRHGSPPKSRRR